MKRFPASVILIVAISNAFDLRGEDGSKGHTPAFPPQGDLAFSNDSIQASGARPIHPKASQFVPAIGIQDSKDLNKTCCLNGGTCILGSFCACPPSFYGRNCEHNTHTQKCGSVPHGAWLPQKCFMCRCWRSQMRCFPQNFLPGCEGHMGSEHPAASRAPRPTPSADTAFLMATSCLLVTWVWAPHDSWPLPRPCN